MIPLDDVRTDPPEPPATRPPRRPGVILGAVAGLLAAAVALGVAELAAALRRPAASPIIAVGGATIDRAPEFLRTFAIDTFGTNDKTALLAGIVVIVVLYAALVGIVAARRIVVGIVGIAVFGVAGALAALSRPGAGLLDALPSLLGAAAGAGVLVLLLGPQREPATATGGAGATGPAVTRPTGGLDRRRFVLIGVGAGAIAALSGGLGRVFLRRFDASASRSRVQVPTPASAAAPVPAGAELGVPGISPFVTPNADFYRVDTALIVPQVSAEEWSLRVRGMVRNELRLDFDELLSRPMVERDITLTCVSNEIGGPYVSTARWIGVPVKDLLDEAGVEAGADQLVSRSVDGWTAGTPIAAVTDGRDALLAVAMNGEPLPIEHGFPVRMIVPGLYGFTSACKWLVDLEVSTFADFDAYWVQRGWAQIAPIKVASRIDTPRPLARLAAGKVAIGGVAYAQRRGIDHVEVRVDGGAWQPAQLGTEDSVDTWRQWYLPWDATPGNHTLEVRATDRAGTTQPEARVAPIPDGATGWHSVVVTVA